MSSIGGPVHEESPAERADDRAVLALVSRIAAGDRGAFEQLYLTYFDRVYGYLRLALGGDQEAEDVAQQVFVKVYEAIRSSRYEAQAGKPFRAWLFVVARNCVRDHWRASGKLELEEPAELERRSDVTGSEQPAPRDLWALRWVSDDDLMLLIERLPEPQQQVLFMRYVLEFTGPEIAEILDRTPESVRQLQSRALRFLEQRLASMSREPSTANRPLPMRSRQPVARLRAAHAFSVSR
jgi:RNA polymerase sigma-70 factor (ECF subfamily)